MKQILFGLFFLLPYPPLSARAHTVSVLVVYYSGSGHTRTMAEAVAQGGKVACN